jgi:hypothetical protein
MEPKVQRWLKRINPAGLDATREPLNVKGICLSATTKRSAVGKTAYWAGLKSRKNVTFPFSFSVKTVS